MFHNEYRQVNKNSYFIDFGITKGYQSSITGSRRNSIITYLLNMKKILVLFDNSDLISLESVTNDTFLNIFNNNLIKSSVKPKV